MSRPAELHASLSGSGADIPRLAPTHDTLNLKDVDA